MLFKLTARYFSSRIIENDISACSKSRKFCHFRQVNRLLPTTSALLRSSYSSLAMVVEMNGTEEKFSKLPEFAKPTNYRITLKPDLKKFTFEGTEIIDIEIVKPTRYLKLNSKDIEVQEAKLKIGSEDYSNLKVVFDTKSETMSVELPDQIPIGPASLTLKFTGTLNEKLDGFYRSTYKTLDGEQRWLASTQFESTFARRAFPCWDEPIYKAQFDITLIVDENLTALSNMDVLSEKALNGWKTVKYSTTPIMSTYLVAFVIGKFDYIEKSTRDGVLVRVYALPGKKDQCHFSLDVACKAIDWFNIWFDVPYPLPKCDLVAIPDFKMGAMENWGLVTYREVVILFDPLQTSTKQKSRAALTIAHELAHMWFGNLVTMKWWTDLWLKEGFASFMEYVVVDAEFPQFDIWMDHMSDELVPAFYLDALKNSHPIEVPIENPNELDEIYDSITYAKGTSINHMLYSYLGEEKFRKGLRSYLKKFQYSNAETVDLWQMLSKASGQDIEALMSPWTKQMGFPLVTVSQRKEENARVLQLSQRRFLADGSEDDDHMIWQIPICVSSGIEPTLSGFKVLMKDKTMETRFEGIKEDVWVKLNHGLTGYYRVEYSDEMLRELLPAVQSKSLPALDRFGLANDLFALVKAGRVSVSQFVSLLAASTDEDNYTVWISLDGGVSAISNILERAEDPQLKTRFKAFIRQLYGPMADKLGWQPKDNEDARAGQFRALVLSRLGRAGHQPTIDEARRRFKEYVDTGKQLDPDTRLTIFCLVARNDGMAAFEQMKKIYETSGFPELERASVISMGQSHDSEVLKAAFEYGIEECKIRPQDHIFLFHGASLHNQGQDFLWPYFRDQMDNLIKRFDGAGNSLFLRAFKLSTSGNCTDKMADAIEDYFTCLADRDCAAIMSRPIKQSTEIIRINAGLLRRCSEPLAVWLQEHGF